MIASSQLQVPYDLYIICMILEKCFVNCRKSNDHSIQS